MEGVIVTEHVLPEPLECQSSFLATLVPQQRDTFTIDRQPPILIARMLTYFFEYATEVAIEQFPVRLALTHNGRHYFPGIERHITSLTCTFLQFNAKALQFARDLLAVFGCRDNQRGVAKRKTGGEHRANAGYEIGVAFIDLD